MHFIYLFFALYKLSLFFVDSSAVDSPGKTSVIAFWLSHLIATTRISIIACVFWSPARIVHSCRSQSPLLIARLGEHKRRRGLDRGHALLLHNRLRGAVIELEVADSGSILQIINRVKVAGANAIKVLVCQVFRLDQEVFITTSGGSYLSTRRGTILWRRGRVVVVSAGWNVQIVE